MKHYRQFIFESYAFNPDAGNLALHYSIDDALHFAETYHFDFPFTDYDPAVLDRALQLLFFMAGVSYYKTYLPPEIEIHQGQINPQLASFLSKTYQKGLGEFWYVNQLDPNTPVNFPTTTHETLVSLDHSGKGILVGIGGGKDSLVSVELLRGQPNVATWSVGHRAQLTPLVKRIGLPHFWVEREWDKQLLHLNNEGAMNGHIPISAILAAVGTIVAILAGKRDVVVSIEQSANEPTLTYQGVAINHQYSKSQEFETDFQTYLQNNFGNSLRYYSLLRPLSELHIAELFTKLGFAKYKEVFSSCNKAFVHDSHTMSWCGECPKCAFVFLALTPFVKREELEQLFNGKNLLLDSALEPTYRQLLGIEGDKPLECVGEIRESRAAMRTAQQQYPELNKYEFELPENYDYRALASHNMPAELYAILQFALRRE